MVTTEGSTFFTTGAKLLRLVRTRELKRGGRIYQVIRSRYRKAA
jgi:hypothetical protein